MAEQEGVTGHNLLDDPLLNEGSAFRESNGAALICSVCCLITAQQSKSN